MTVLRLCFGWKAFLKMLFHIYGCLVAHGKYIFWKCFSVGLSTGVNWFPFLFYLQIPIFRKTERELRERETHPRAKRERERERGRRERGRSVRCSTSTSPFDFEFVRLRRSTSPSRWLWSQSQHRFVIPDCKPRFVVLDHDLAFVPITIAGAALIRDLAFTFDNTYFVNLFYYSTYFYYYLWALLHFLVLFIGLTYYFS